MIGSKVNFAGALCFGMKQSQEIMLNQATLVSVCAWAKGQET